MCVPVGYSLLDPVHPPPPRRPQLSSPLKYKITFSSLLWWNSEFVWPSDKTFTTSLPNFSDIDECLMPSTCPDEQCVNSPGSYQCIPCTEGFRGWNGQCLGRYHHSPIEPFVPLGGKMKYMKFTSSSGKFLIVENVRKWVGPEATKFQKGQIVLIDPNCP